MAKEYRQNADWCEEDHPREPAGNSKGGQFVSKSEILKETKKHSENTNCQVVLQKDMLKKITSWEWRKFYIELQKIEYGVEKAVTDRDGNWYIPIDNLLFVTIPDYEAPKCWYVLKFWSSQDLKEYMESWGMIND